MGLTNSLTRIGRKWKIVESNEDVNRNIAVLIPLWLEDGGTVFKRDITYCYYLSIVV
ncbi:hypothetical protein N8035_02960 [Algibacter sp.]|nr:hypothetical protein [Algibacter sp.]